MTPRRTTGVLLAVVLGTSVLSGCGDGGDDDPTVAVPTATSSAFVGPVAATPCEGAPQAQPAPAGSSRDLSKKPPVPKGPASVTSLQVYDVVVGSGAQACTGSTVEVKYVGVLADGGAEFDASWNRGDTFPVTLGQNGVIQGWETGLLGMKAGGRRQLTIPAELAYGPEGRPPTIPGGATLVFVIDAVSVT